MSEELEAVCPYCGSQMENGFVWRMPGNAVELGDFLMGWFTGDSPPKKGWVKDWQPLEPFGESHAMKGSYAAGKRCTRCRKIILDY